MYTILSMSQEISVKIVGPNQRVVIKLDMDLYKMAVQLQMAAKNKHWLLQPAHLHKFLADIHASGKIVEGSGLDIIAVESRVYSAAVSRCMCAGNQYTLGEIFHIINALAILSPKLEFKQHLEQKSQKI